MAIPPEELTELAYKISERFEKVNTFYLSKMSQQIKNIGELNASNMIRLEQLAKMGNNIEEINLYLSKQTGLALKDIYEVYDKSAAEIYKDVSYLYKARGLTQPKFAQNLIIQNYIESVKQLTKGTFLNMARTTVISQSYRDTIDLAIDIVATGLGDYTSVMRRELIKKAQNGMRVRYASGYTRRLDSACRMNVLEGVRQINYGVRKEAGIQYGADGVEIDAHGLCADDHLPYQGRQYSLSKFDEINNKLRRKFGTCNCKHGISYIILGVSPLTYSQKELNTINEYANKPIQIRDKEVTRYEASQIMRDLETKMRYKKDEIITLRTAGMDTDKEKEQLKILQNNYYYVSKRAGLKPRYEKAYVPNFRK